MIDILFPTNQVNHHYYTKHADFIFKMADLADKNYSFQDSEIVWYTSAAFSFSLNEKQIVVDTADSTDISLVLSEVLYFKYHYNSEAHYHIKNVYPLGSMLISPGILDLYKNYYSLIETDFYNSSNNLILCKQRPYGKAVQRRKLVQEKLSKAFGNQFDEKFERNNKPTHWKAMSKCLVTVCVPGARNDMIDRGHMEAMGLGVCVIAPPITDVLAGWKFISPGVHYVECESDYSNIVETVQWCQHNRDACQEIGNNAKKLFSQFYTPENYWKWIEECSEEFYG